MKKMILLTCLCCTFLACEDIEKKADKKLQAAREAFEQGNYSEAKILIDSIKILYPKAFETRRAGIGLMQEVELQEQEKAWFTLTACCKPNKRTLMPSKVNLLLKKMPNTRRQAITYIPPK